MMLACPVFNGKFGIVQAQYHVTCSYIGNVGTQKQLHIWNPRHRFVYLLLGYDDDEGCVQGSRSQRGL